MTEAYQSVINISFNVRFGLIMRQAHHWAALIFLAAVLFHMCRDLLHRGLPQAPGDQLDHRPDPLAGRDAGGLHRLLPARRPPLRYRASGSSTRSSRASRSSGTWLVYNLWGGRFPGPSFITRLFVIHEFLFPAIIVGLLTAHLMILWHQKHTDFPGPGKTETNIRGSRIWPQYALKAGGLFMIVSGVTFALAGLVQINPVWLYGPYTPYTVSIGAQPDWYLGWLDGSVRLWPHWEFRSFGHDDRQPRLPGPADTGPASSRSCTPGRGSTRRSTTTTGPQPPGPPPGQTVPNRRGGGGHHLLRRS